MRLCGFSQKKQLVLKKQKEKKRLFFFLNLRGRAGGTFCNSATTKTHTHMHVRMKKRVEKVCASVGREGFLRDGNKEEKEP